MALASRIGVRMISCLLFVLCFSTATIAAEIKVVSSVYEPYRITSTTGIITEIFLAACRAEGLPVSSIVMLPSERARVVFENDPNTIYLDSDSYIATAKNPDFKILKQWPFHALIYYDKKKFASGGPKTIKDFSGKVMGYYRADIGTKSYFSGQGLIMQPLDLQSQLFVMLVHQRIDLFISVDENANLEFGKSDPAWRDHIGIFGPFYSGFAGPIFHNDNATASAFIDSYLKGYRKIQNDGTMLDILERYYGKGKAPATFFK